MTNLAGTAAGRPALTLIAASIGLFMMFLDVTVVNVALPDIQASFQGGEASLQWVVAGYSLTQATLIMTAATLADLMGRRRVYLVALIVFSVSSAGCGFAPNLATLNIARGVQGAAAAAINVSSLALLSAAYPDPKTKAKAFGIWTGIANLAAAIGPTVGGLLTSSLGWRAIFLINLPFGLLACALTAAWVAESSAPTGRRLDLPGQVLFVGTIGALIYAVIEAPRSGWGSPLILALFAIGAVGVASFIAVELQRPGSMMDLRVFADRTYSVAIFALFTAMFSVYGMLLVTTQYLQNVAGFTARAAGPLLLPFSLSIAAFAPLAGRIVASVGARLPILLGFACLTVGLALVGFGVGSSLALVLVGLLIMGTGVGLYQTPITTIAMAGAPPERAGMASGIMSAQRGLGSTVGVAALGTILAASITVELPGRLASVVPEPAQRDALIEEIVGHANPRAYVAAIGPGRPIPNAPTTERRAILAAADAAFVIGIREALLVGLAVVLAGLIASAIALPRGGSAPAQGSLQGGPSE